MTFQEVGLYRSAPRIVVLGNEIKFAHEKNGGAYRSEASFYGFLEECSPYMWRS